jgi:hypothetical protein
MVDFNRPVVQECNMPFATLTAEEEKELYRLQRFYWKEALRCEEAKAYLAGCVMLGSALETLLIQMINCYPEEAEQTGKLPRDSRKRRKLLKWDFADLLAVAKAANWLPSALDLNDEWSSRRARIGDYAEVVRKVRNLAHPARYAADYYRSRVTAKHLQRQFEVVLLCRDWLVERNNKSLLEHMKAEDIE